MNWDEIERNWGRLKGQAKLRWPKLGTEQLGAIAGRRSVLALRLQDTYDLSREEAERELINWQNGLQPRPAPRAQKSPVDNG
jgi:uncharacterized protein YjbJ (UPF0337 family)